MARCYTCAMSVYRTLAAADLDLVRRVAGADALPACEPISAGIENSNWFVTCRRGDIDTRLVLTLVEAATATTDRLDFVIALADALAAAGLPAPVALTLIDGRRRFVLQERPALLVPVLPGAHVAVPTLAQCHATGALLARLHVAGSRCTQGSPQGTDAQWWPTAFAPLAPSLAPDQRAELSAALQAGSVAFAAAAALPHGIIHGDLFRDNVLFTGADISGVLDFHHATRDLLAWDLAIALNDWAFVADQPDQLRADALLAGYESVRVLAQGERDLLPVLRRTAAARFWLSRLLAAQRAALAPAHASGVSGVRKDPEQMRAWLRALSG